MVEVVYDRYGIFQYATITSDDGWRYCERALTKRRAAKKAFLIYTRGEGR